TQLVRLTVIDMDVNHRCEGKRLEVGHSIVHVQGELEIVRMVERVQRIEPPLEDHWQTGDFERAEQRGSFAQNQDDSVRLVQFFEHRDPLLELIEFRTPVTEVDHYLSLDIATVVFIFETVPSFGASDPPTCCLPGR